MHSVFGRHASVLSNYGLRTDRSDRHKYSHCKQLPPPIRLPPQAWEGLSVEQNVKKTEKSW